MIRLGSARHPAWYDLPHDVRIAFRPFDHSILLTTSYAHPGDDGEAALNRTISRLQAYMVDWEGVGDANGKPLPCTPEGVRMLYIDVPGMANAMTEALGEHLTRWEEEGNASAPAPNGSAERAEPSAATAAPSTGPAPKAASTPPPGSAAP